VPLASTTEENQALVTTGWAYVALHSASPGQTGASELTSYTRATCSAWTTGTGVVSNTNSLNITVPAGQTAQYFGVWSAASGGTYYIGGALSSSVAGPNTCSIAAGALTITAS
jgi:hypothetical protein